MHGQTQSSNTHIRKLLTRKVKTSMMHIFDVVKARVSQKAKKASSRSTQQSTASKQGHNMKAPLTRKLTQDEINEAELALERLQAEKRRLEDLLNRVSDKHSISSQKSYSNSCEDVSNNNVHKELVRVPRYQQKTAFILHNVFSAEECSDLSKELESNAEDSSCSASIESHTTHSEAMLSRLWPVLEKEVPKTWMGNTLLGLSNRCTFEKQSESYSHKAGMDEAYEPIEGKEKSFLSVYVFLNDDYEGGQSSFLKNWQPSAHDVKVKPTRGSILVHQHNLLHEITPVTSGQKQVVRFDVMYNTAKRDILSELYD